MPGLGVHAAPWRERFWQRVEKTDGCWLWRGGLRNGYGVLSIDGRKEYAHRISFAIHRGSVPTGLDLDHLCRTPKCVNPDHLEAVTHAENIRRGNSPYARARRQRLATGKCINGHDATEWDVERGWCRACRRIYRRKYYEREKRQRSVRR